MYYKAIKSFLSFNEAIEEFNRGQVIRLNNKILNPHEISLDKLKFSINELQSKEWEVVVIDNDMQNKLEEVQDMMHNIKLDIDSRFYNEDYMNIPSYWNLFESQFILGNENLQYELIKHYALLHQKNNNKFKKDN